MVNIFWLVKAEKKIVSPGKAILNYHKCAQAHIDSHIVKIPLEATQLLYNAHCTNPFDKNWRSKAPKTKSGGQGYQAFNPNNPISVWIRSHVFHYRHAVCYGLALCDEYTFRFKRAHHCEEHLKWLQQNEPNIPKESSSLRQPWCACPEKYKLKPPTEEGAKVGIEAKVEEETKKAEIEEVKMKPSIDIESLIGEIQQRIGKNVPQDETEYEIEPYVVDTYRDYYCNEKLKVKMATWREREVPDFVIKFREGVEKKTHEEAEKQEEEKDFEAEIELSKEIEKDIKKRKNLEKQKKKKKEKKMK